VGLVALAASHPETAWTAVTVGRGEPGRPKQSVLGPLTGDRARKILEQLVELYDQGLREPLPMAIKASAAYAAARRNQGDVDEAVRMARRQWVSGDFPGEDADAANELVWGRRADLDVLLTEEALLDPRAQPEPTRFGALAVRLWAPLLAAERIDIP
jgi:exodeoxyribonuclease V gamma subunit